MKLKGLLIFRIIPKPRALGRSTVGSHPQNSTSGEWKLGYLGPPSETVFMVR